MNDAELTKYAQYLNGEISYAELHNLPGAASALTEPCGPYKKDEDGISCCVVCGMDWPECL